ncbi:MAG: hypothetical protein K4571_09305 [Deltaproteobacteria bacterium]
MKRNLFLKIFFSYLAIVFFSFLVLNVFIKDEIQKVLTAKIEGELLTYAELVDLSSAKEMSDQLRQIAGISGSRVTLVDAQGKVFADSEKDSAKLENHLNRPEIQEARLRDRGKSIRFSQSLGVEMLYVAVPIKIKGQISGYVRLARPLHDVKNLIEKVYQSIFLTLILVSIVSLVIALFISYKLAQPIRALERFTEKLRQGETRGSIILQTSDETRKLADNINFLVEELQSKIRLAQEERSKLMTALTSIKEGVLILNAEEKIEFVSPSLTAVLSGRTEDYLGKTLLEAFRNAELQKAFQRFKENRLNVSYEVTLGYADALIMSVSMSDVQEFPGGEKVMVVFQDVTHLKKLERVRTDFVANVTHEIRTPLAAIIGYLDTLQAGALDHPDDAKRFIGIMLNQAQRLNRLVEDLMTISKIELGEVILHFEDVSLPEAADNVISLLAVKASDKGIKVQNSLPQGLPQIKADRDRLSQIFVNVLDNAVKFTPPGGRITIDAEEKAGSMAVRITDTGTGIPREDLQRLGERFYRGDKARSRDLGGTGLGLSIVKHLMLAHGGKMEIESQPGKGTRVSLFFPMQEG